MASVRMSLGEPRWARGGPSTRHLCGSQTALIRSWKRSLSTLCVSGSVSRTQGGFYRGDTLGVLEGSPSEEEASDATEW